MFESAINTTGTLLAKYKALHRGPSSFDPEAIPARRRFLTRQVKLLTNLVLWRKHAGERYDMGILVKNFVSTCILEVAEEGWEVGGEAIARKVCPAQMLPYIYSIFSYLLFFRSPRYYQMI